MERNQFYHLSNVKGVLEFLQKFEWNGQDDAYESNLRKQLYYFRVSRVGKR